MRSLLLLCCCVGCAAEDPLDATLPVLPPEGGAPLARAGRLTEANFAAERVPGPASQGLPGDYFLANDEVRVIVQAPGRAIGPCPFGGNLLDADRVDAPAGDQLGEVSTFLQLGRTLVFTEVQILRDGRKGGPAAITLRGHDAINDFINVTGLGSFAVGVQEDYRATIDLGLKAQVTYVLYPGETRVRAYYGLYNPGKLDVATTWGTLTDTGAQIEMFHPRLGFGETDYGDLLAQALPLTSYVGLLGQGIAYGVVPRYDDPKVLGSSFPVAGVAVELYDVPDAFAPLGPGGTTLHVPRGGTATREVDLVVGRELGDVTAQVLAVRGEATQPFSGRVEGGAARVRVSSATLADEVVTTLSTDADGRFAGALPPGRYSLQAEAVPGRRGAAVEVDLPASDLALAVPPAARLDYTVHERIGTPLPATITVVGAPSAPPDRRFRDTRKDPLPYGVAAFHQSLSGHDGPLALAPGRYRVVVAHGPRFSRVEQVIDLTAAGATIDATLDEIAPTPGYVACDFHQHSYLSPDSPVPPIDRIVGYLAQGIDFISSSEHDVHFDYAPLIAQLGVEDRLRSAVGVETTPFDYGHFIGFPLPVDPLSPNGGAFDWGGGEAELDRPPGMILDGLRGLGAQIVQVNHPRAPANALSSFQHNFDRAGLRFDFAAHTFDADVGLQPLTALALGLPEGAPLFSDHFDTLEVYNGFHLGEREDGDRADRVVDAVLRDLMDFVSFGFVPTAVGDSDSHQWYSLPPGLPRTLVAVPDAARDAGLTEAIVATLGGRGVPRDVIVTNGPFLRLTVDGQGIGRTVAHAAGPLHVEARVVTPAWAEVDTIEIFANATFDTLKKGGTPAPLQPVLCGTTRAAPSARCAGAIGGARALMVRRVEAFAGDPNTARLELTLEAQVDPAELAARNRAGAAGADLWLLARATGDRGLFPVIPVGIDPSVPLADLVERGDLAGRGVPALAFTNPIFVDVDGGGWRAPFAP